MSPLSALAAAAPTTTASSATSSSLPAVVTHRSLLCRGMQLKSAPVERWMEMTLTCRGAKTKYISHFL